MSDEAKDTCRYSLRVKGTGDFLVDEMAGRTDV